MLVIYHRIRIFINHPRKENEMKQILFLLICAGFILAGETTATYKVEGMMCGVNCPMKVKQSLEGVDGVKLCQVDFEAKTATVTFDDEKISREKIAETISNSTYFKVTDTEKKSWSLFGWLFGKS